MRVGEVKTWKRTFSEEDVRLFGKLSGDEGRHHVEPDEQGRLLVQGLLTATLPTKIGGDMNFIATEMTFHFHRPVFVGDTVECLVTIVELENESRHTRMRCEVTCLNQHAKQVLSGTASGIIRNI